MKWKRATAGRSRYEAGPYVVEHRGHAHGWFVCGPGLAEHHPLKADAQAAALKAAQARAANPAVTPVVGDFGVLADGRRGQLTAIMRGAPGGTSPGLVSLYCFRLPRGRRTCVFRYEFQVVMP